LHETRNVQLSTCNLSLLDGNVPRGFRAGRGDDLTVEVRAEARMPLSAPT